MLPAAAAPQGGGRNGARDSPARSEIPRIAWRPHTLRHRAAGILRRLVEVTVLTEWLERADWRHKSAEFDELAELTSREWGVLAVTRLAVPESASGGLRRLWELWSALTAHSHILEISANNEGWLVYAALDWCAPRAPLHDAARAHRVSDWGLTLVHVFEHVASCIPQERLGWLACPFVKLDLEGEPRVGFLPPHACEDWRARLPPEVAESWPRCDERGLVFVVGQLLASLVTWSSQSTARLVSILERATARDPAQRFADLAALRQALLAGRSYKHVVSSRSVWRSAEAGLGLVAIDRRYRASPCFDEALRLDLAERIQGLRRKAPTPRTLALRACRDELLVRTGIARRHWAAACEAAQPLEQAARFAEARAIYLEATAAGDDEAARQAALARCALEMGDLAPALDHARRALADSLLAPDALAACARVLLAGRCSAQALTVAERWLAAAPDDGNAQLARGKSLLGLHRFADARDELDRASARLRGAKLLEAMILRREADRKGRELRATTGTAVALTMDLPSYLDDIRALLVAGHQVAAIEQLRQPAYDADAAAQLVLANLLAFERRTVEALAAYDRVVGLGGPHLQAALLGKADVLLETGEAELALRVFERVLAERPGLRDATEGRARALHELGRFNEAEVAMQQYVSAIGDRADLRVRTVDEVARPLRR